MKNSILLITILFISCSGGGNGSNDNNNDKIQFNRPILHQFKIESDSGPGKTPAHEKTYLLGQDEKIRFWARFTVEDPDLDARQVIWEAYNDEDIIIEEIIDLPETTKTLTNYITDPITITETGVFTVIAYVIDGQGLESNEIVQEICIMRDLFDETKCELSSALL